MIYLHEVRHVRGFTGYGGAFQNLYLELSRLLPGQLISHDYVVLGQDRSIDVEIFFGPARSLYLDSFKHRHADVRGIFTMYESEILPQDYMDVINEHFDFIIVPSLWCEGVFRRHFPLKPIYLVPLGIDPTRFPVLKRSASRQPFTVLWQGFLIKDRKRGDRVREAFRRLQLPNSRLICKTLSAASSSKTVLYLTGPDGVSYVSDTMSHAEQLSLWQTADLGVIPSEAEGVGLIPLEWMATGMATAFSANTGAIEFCDKRYNYPLTCVRQDDTVFKDRKDPTAPTVDHIAEVIEHVYKHRSEAHEKGVNAAAWVRVNFNYNRAARKFAGVINHIKETLCRQPTKSLS